MSRPGAQKTGPCEHCSRGLPDSRLPKANDLGFCGFRDLDSHVSGPQEAITSYFWVLFLPFVVVSRGSLKGRPWLSSMIRLTNPLRKGASYLKRSSALLPDSGRREWPRCVCVCGKTPTPPKKTSQFVSSKVCEQEAKLAGTICVFCYFRWGSRWGRLSSMGSRGGFPWLLKGNPQDPWLTQGFGPPCSGFPI